MAPGAAAGGGGGCRGGHALGAQGAPKPAAGVWLRAWDRVSSPRLRPEPQYGPQLTLTAAPGDPTPDTAAPMDGGSDCISMDNGSEHLAGGAVLQKHFWGVACCPGSPACVPSCGGPGCWGAGSRAWCCPGPRHWRPSPRWDAGRPQLQGGQASSDQETRQPCICVCGGFKHKHGQSESCSSPHSLKAACLWAPADPTPMGMSPPCGLLRVCHQGWVNSMWTLWVWCVADQTEARRPLTCASSASMEVGVQGGQTGLPT